MTDLRTNETGYPYVSPADMRWIVSLIESKVKNPDEIKSVARNRNGLDLEIVFEVTDSGRHIFTPAICLEITRQVAKRTGVIKPVIYILDDPHPSARESLDWAAQQV